MSPPQLRTQFNLIDEPWIGVLGRAGHELVSIRDAFGRAGELRQVAGDLPTQDAAIVRLLLAILHRCVGTTDGDPVNHWQQLWQEQDLLAMVGQYLDDVHDRFDLISADEPFMQSPGLSARGTSGLTKLIADAPDGSPFFSTRGGAELSSMSFAEAARWLVHCHAFDVSGIKTGVIGDERVKGGKSYPIGTGWTGRCGLTIVEGESLRETLLLNLRVRRDEEGQPPDVPVWERPPVGPGPEADHARPCGPADIMTWPSRRILLHHNGSRITDVLLSNGTSVRLQNQHTVEDMTGFRRSEAQQKALGMDLVYMPRNHDPERLLWRGLGNLLPPAANQGAAADSLSAPTIEWIVQLVGNGVLGADHPVRLHAVGMSYGSNDSVVATVYDDALRLRTSVAARRALRNLAIDAAHRADLVARHVGDAARDIARAAGGMPDGPRGRAREEFFFRLDEPFRLWLSTLRDGTDPADAAADWHQQVRRVAREVVDGIVADAGETAWKGREIEGRLTTTSTALKWFNISLSKILPADELAQKEAS